MAVPIIGLFFGVILGGMLAGYQGGVAGAVCGIGLGMAWISLRTTRPRVPKGALPHREKHDVMCIPRGQVAECTLLRDRKTGEFLDVESCSLEPAGQKPRCTRRCLDMLDKSTPQKDVATSWVDAG